METLKGAATWIVSELRVLWFVLSFLIEMLIKWFLSRFPTTKARILADIEQQYQMQSFRGNWKVQPKMYLITRKLSYRKDDTRCAICRLRVGALKIFGSH